MNNRLYTLLALLTLGFVSNAQSSENYERQLLDRISDSETLIRQLNNDEQIFGASFEFGPRVFLKQAGDDNSVSISQQGSSVIVNVLQNQVLNTTNINQDGTRLYSGVIQDGAGNQVDLDLIGHRIATGVYQRGVRNAVDLDLIGDNMLYGIIQVGTNHSITQAAEDNEIGLGFNSKLLRIRQSGNGANLIIKQK